MNLDEPKSGFGVNTLFTTVSLRAFPKMLPVTGTELKPGYEYVFTVTEYYDGPRKGIANFKGLPHSYECVSDQDKDEYSDLYRLTLISDTSFELAKEDWAIRKKWETAFHLGKATLESHPVLPQDRARHQQLRQKRASRTKSELLGNC